MRALSPESPQLSAAEELARAAVLLDERKLREAYAGFKRAERAGADADACAGGRWMAAMLLGEFAAAWRESDAIRGRGSPDPHRFWNGERVEGRRVMLRCLHGYGDAVQMLRYLPQLRALAAEVTVEVPPRLLSLAPFFEGMDRCVTWGEEAPARAPEWDVQIEIMELPYLFRTELAQLPLATGYLKLPGDVLRTAAGSLGSRQRPRVGLVWAAGEWNPTRSIPFSAMAALTEERGIEFWSLQGGEARQDAASLLRAGQLGDGERGGGGIVALASTIAQLDLVITVDSLAAHLAGALQRPAWVLLQQYADWRWMEGREDSPWYPSLRLFRCGAGESWEALVERVRLELPRAGLLT